VTLTDDRALRRKILPLLYAAWKIQGKQGFLSQNELIKNTGAEPVAVARNLDLLCDLGLRDAQEVLDRLAQILHPEKGEQL